MTCGGHGPRWLCVSWRPSYGRRRVRTSGCGPYFASHCGWIPPPPPTRCKTPQSASRPPDFRDISMPHMLMSPWRRLGGGLSCVLHLAGGDHAVVVGEHDRRRTVPDPELAEDAAHVRLDRGLGHVQGG